MQRISFAPVLSATRSRDSCWITSNSQILCGDSRAGSVNRLSDHPRADAPTAWRRRCVRSTGDRDAARTRASRPGYSYPVRPRRAGALRGPSLLRLLEDLDQPPPLGGRRRPGLHDLHAVADAGDPLLVVRLQLARTTDDLAVQAVLHAVLDLDDDGLLHLVADDQALAHLAVPATGQAGPTGGLPRFLRLAHATPSFGATDRPSSRSRMIV